MSDSREAILEAAAAEFAEHGFDGVRMEHVARRAGYNKALVYRHFGDRRGLFEATLRRLFAEREALLDDVPDTLAEMLVFWARAQREDRHFLTLVLREALRHEGGEPIEADSRRAYYARQIEMLRGLQEEGTVEPALESRMLFLALLGVTVVPVILPQIARLATGLAPEGEEFQERWQAALVQLAEALRPRG